MTNFNLKLALMRWAFGLGTGLAVYLKTILPDHLAQLDPSLAAGYALAGLIAAAAVDFHAFKQATG